LGGRPSRHPGQALEIRRGHLRPFADASALPKWGQPDFDGQQLGAATFGGDKWDRPGSDLPAATDELLTFMRQKQIRLPNGSKVAKPYLDHEEFVYFLRLENLAARQQQVTVRVFITPAELASDRRAWIEMDKFTHTLGPQKKDVVFRSERHSSVVRKPAWRPSEPKPPRPPGTVDLNYCDCGWPLHVFLPRGTEKGMEFAAFVMLTDFERTSRRGPARRRARSRPTASRVYTASSSVMVGMCPRALCVVPSSPSDCGFCRETYSAPKTWNPPRCPHGTRRKRAPR